MMNRLLATLVVHLERPLWFVVKRFFPPRRIGDIDFVYIDAEGNRSEEAIAEVLKKALQFVSLAKGGFGELVTSHLRLVIAVPVRSYTSPNLRALVTSFEGQEGTHSQYLACQLVWAATYIRLAHDADAHHKRLDRPAARRTAFESELRFVKLLPNAEEWERYLRLHHPHSPNRAKRPG